MFKKDLFSKKILFVLVLSLVISMAGIVCAAETYTVKPGDTLANIVAKTGVSSKELMELNDIKNPTLIYAGDILKLGAKGPKYVFYLIGDGMGGSQRQSAEYYLKLIAGDDDAKLTMNKFPVAGINTTQSADTLVTDSAAAGTALATGHKTNNGMISQLPDGTNVKTVLEVAQEKGMATGVITTTRLTHATPATFASHVESRYMPDKIANQYVESGVDFFAGGGYRYFIPGSGLEYKGETLKSKRKDNRNLVQEFANKGYNTFLSEEDTDKFRYYQPEGREKVFAAFTYSHTPYEVDRRRTDSTPSIAEMTEKGIDVLSKYEDGFFMMVEGGRIDHACHANDPVGAIHDTLAFDKAVAKVYEFYKEHPEETLIVVTADHETGGYGLGFAKQYFLKLENLKKAKVSVDDVLMNVYNGDREAYFDYIAENLGMDDLTSKERATITKAMDIVDNKEDYDVAMYGPDYYCPVAIATTHVLSTRAGIEWTTYAHSATPIPTTAIGVEAEGFGGYKDNTDLAKTMADVLGGRLTN